jgi:PAS domain S-box-containing protein
MSSDRLPSVDDQTLRLRQILDSSPALIHTGTPDGYLDFFNRRWCEFVGKPAEALRGWGWTTCVHPDDIGVLLEKWRESIATGNPLEVEARVRRADGEFRWMLHQKIAQRDADGTILQWHGTSLDIEGRKQAEDSLRQTIEKLQTNKHILAEAQRLGKMGSWSFDPAKGFDHWSPELFQIHGLEPAPQAPTFEVYLALVHPEDRESMASTMDQMFVEAFGFDVTKRIIRPDGQLRYIRCVGSASFETAGLKQIGVGVDVTEHELLTQELRHREAHLAEAQRLGHIGSWVFEPTGAFEYWSDELFRIYGLDPGRAAPTLDEYLACVHQHDREFIALRIERAIAEASGCDVTQRIVRPNGEVRYIRCVGVPVLENGTLKRIVGSAIDVTEHELLTRELRRREAYLAEAQRLSHTGSFGWKPDTGEIVWSDETYRIFEYDPAVKPTLDLLVRRLHPQDRAFFQQVSDRASQTGSDFEHEYRLLLDDGRVKYVHALAHALQDASGNREFIGAVTDITERKTAEEKIRRSETELRTIIEIMPAYMGSSLPDGTVDFLSESWLDYTGQTREEAMGWGWAGVLHPDDADRVLANWQAGLASGKPVDQEFRCRREDGTYHWFLNRSLPLHNDEGKIIKWYGILFDVNALKETESALQAREHELLSIIETIPSMLWSTSPTGEPSHNSQRLLEYFGVSHEEFVNRGWLSFLHPDDRVESAKVFLRAIETGESYNVIHRAQRADGEYRWHHTRGEPLRDPQGKIVQWYGLSIDIDERKRTEEALRKSERELRTLIDQMPAFVGTASPDGSCDFLSESWLDYLGFTLEQGLGWGWASTIHPEDFDRVVANWRAGLAAGEPVEQELRCRRADGTYLWFLNRDFPLRDDGGNIIKWYGVLTNIDALKKIESALKIRENELLGIVETIPSMLWSTSPTGESTHLSQRLLEYFGAPFEEFLSRGWERFIHPDDREETAKAFLRAMETGESYNAINRLRRADGEYRWHHTRGEALRDPQGKIIQWYGLSIDIDERKRAEDSLRDTSIRLSTASKIATVAELSASIAHELNQPLMAVLGNAQAAKRWLAANPPDLTETNASIERILRDIRSADEAMQHIRALFKSEPYEKRDESVLDIIRESLRFIHEDPNKRDVQIDWSIEGNLPPVYVDRIQIQQVFINLISNAIEATDGSENAAKILMRPFVTQEHEVIVQVIDNGTGLEDTEKIFDAFMTTKEKGLGIGLAVSRSIVEAHGGRLWAENNPDGGATFNVALPASSNREVR